MYDFTEMLIRKLRNWGVGWGENKNFSPPDIKNGHGALRVHKRSSNKKQTEMKSTHTAPAILS